MKNQDKVVLAYLMHELDAFIGQTDGFDMPRGDEDAIFRTARDFAAPPPEKGFNIKHARHEGLLEALLSRIYQEKAETEPGGGYFFPLADHNPREPTLFPQPANRLVMPKTTGQQKKTGLSRRGLTESYRKISRQFSDELTQMQSLPANADPSKLCKSRIRSLLNLLEYYSSQIPVENPGVSLFDRTRAAAAITEGLYLHSEADQSPSTDTETPKWLLVRGELHGMRTLILEMTGGDGNATSLFGWSWFMQLLCIGVSEQIIRKLDLNATAKICSAGDGFHLLAPRHFKRRLAAIADGINTALFQEFQGEIYLGLGFSEPCGQDFKSNDLGKHWLQADKDLRKNLLQPFKTQIDGDKLFFEPHPLDRWGMDKKYLGQENGFDASESRRTQSRPNPEEFANALADSRCLFWTWGEDACAAANQPTNFLFRLELPGTDAVVYLLENAPEFSAAIDLSAAHLEYLRDWPGFKTNVFGYSQGQRRLASWMPGFEPDWFRNRNSDGLGVLHMDVDDLREIFARGLDNRDGGRHGSLSAMATLSRQLHVFFNDHVPALLAGHEHCGIILAGGGDVTIIGDWRKLPKVAYAIGTEFQKYCAFNPTFTLSAGIALTGGKYPLAHAIALAEQAAESAKNLQRGAKRKDALCFLNTRIGWESFPEALELLHAIDAIASKTRSRAIIHRLREVVTAVDNLEKNHRGGHVGSLIQSDKWLWRLVYNLADLKQNFPAIQGDLNKLLNLLISPQNPRNKQAVMNWLPLPVNWADILHRSDTNDRRHENLY